MKFLLFLTFTLIVIPTCFGFMPHPQPENQGGSKSGNIYVVDINNGSDSNPGTEELPFKLFSKGISVLKPGDTLLVKDGEYYEHPGSHEYNNWNITTSGKPDYYITIKAYPGHTPRFKVDTMNGIQLWDSSYVELNGLFVYGNGVPREAKGTLENSPERVKYKNTIKYNGNGISVVGKNGWSHIRVINCTVENVGGNGFAFSGGTLLWVENNIARYNAMVSEAGNSGMSTYHMQDNEVVPDNYGIVFIGNTSHGNRNMVDFIAYQPFQLTDGNGIIIDSNNSEDESERKSYKSKVLLVNNLTYNNGGRGLHAFNSSNVDMINNTLYHNVQSEDMVQLEADLYAVSGSKNVRMVNNLVVSAPGRKSFGIADELTVNVKNNIFVTDRADMQTIDDSNIINADPKLTNASIDATQIAFKPLSGSVAVGKALPTWTPPYDILGNIRSRQSPTIGAFEVALSEKEITSSGEAISSDSSILDTHSNGDANIAPNTAKENTTEPSVEANDGNRMIVLILSTVVAIVALTGLFFVARKK